MLWSNTSVRLAVALHLILQPISPRRQRSHDCVDAWCSSRLKKAALKLDQITGSELVCCHETTPISRSPVYSTAHTVAPLGRQGAPACRIPNSPQNEADGVATA